MIRSATQVTAEVLAAGSDLVVVGRAGIGLDNVDVAEATRRGVMVVNAPQSNILSAAEHTLALLLAQARNVPQANADLRAGKWNRSRWEGVELHGKTLGIVGLGRVGVLVAQRAHAFGMRLVAYDPFVNAERARQIGVQLVATIEELFATCDFVSIHATKTPADRRPRERRRCSSTPSPACVSSTPGGAASSTRRRSPTRSATGSSAAPRSTRSRTSRPPSRRCSTLDNVVVTPHLGASTSEAQDKAGVTIAEQVVLALRGDFVPFAVNVAAIGGLRDRAAVPAARGATRPAVHGSRRRRRPKRSRSPTRARSPTTTAACSRSRSSRACSVRSSTSRSPFVNAPQLAEERGIAVRETKSSDARDYVNLVTVRGEGGTHVAATLFGKQDAPRIVGIDDHRVDLPPSRHLLVVHNEDVPGMIGTVATILGDAQINISDMEVGTSPTGEAALMAIATDTLVSAEVVRRITESDGVTSAVAIDLE